MRGINKGDVDRVLKINSHDKTRTNTFNIYKYHFRKDIGRNWFGEKSCGQTEPGFHVMQILWTLKNRQT